MNFVELEPIRISPIGCIICTSCLYNSLTIGGLSREGLHVLYSVIRVGQKTGKILVDCSELTSDICFLFSQRKSY